MTLSIRPCSANELARLIETASKRDVTHHRERFDMQASGEATYLLAWSETTLVGRGTVLVRSKYEEVRVALGDFPEINALEATPAGQGTGTAFMRFTEEMLRAASRLGLAVESENHGAACLYERLGYTDWGRGYVVDEWHECDDDGERVHSHFDVCRYLTKSLTLTQR